MRNTNMYKYQNLHTKTSFSKSTIDAKKISIDAKKNNNWRKESHFVFFSKCFLFLKWFILGLQRATERALPREDRKGVEWPRVRSCLPNIPKCCQHANHSARKLCWVSFEPKYTFLSTGFIANKKLKKNGVLWRHPWTGTWFVASSK